MSFYTGVDGISIPGTAIYIGSVHGRDNVRVMIAYCSDLGTLSIDYAAYVLIWVVRPAYPWPRFRLGYVESTASRGRFLKLGGSVVQLPSRDKESVFTVYI